MEDPITGELIRIDMSDALHFKVRHWHITKNDYTEEDGFVKDDEDSGDNDNDKFTNNFTVVEGYIRPNDDKSGYTFYRYLNGVLTEVSDPADPEINYRAQYFESWNPAIGELVLKSSPTVENGEQIGKFAGFSVSAGQDAVTTDSVKETLTITYKPDVHLVKAHVFYVSAVRVIGADFKTLFGGDKVDWYDPEQDTVFAYRYNKQVTDKAGKVHNAGEIVKVNDGEKDRAVFVVMENGEEHFAYLDDNGERVILGHVKDCLPEGVKFDPEDDENDIDKNDIEKVKIYNTSKGLHTDKSASESDDYLVYNEETGEWEHDGRTFDLDLEAWYAEGKLADVGLILDASGSMAWTTTNPKPVNIYDENLGLDSSEKDQLKGKVGFIEENGAFTKSVTVDFPQKDKLIGYYEFQPNNSGDKRTWFLNSKKFTPSTSYYNNPDRSYLAKVVPQPEADGVIDFSAAKQSTLIDYHDYPGASGWGGVPLTFSEANGLCLSCSHGKGILLEEAPASDNFTLSFSLYQSLDNAYTGKIEILYIGGLTGNVSDSDYFHVYRTGSDVVAAMGQSNTLFTFPDLYKGAGDNHKLTFVFEDGSVKAYLDGFIKGTANVGNLSGRNVVFDPFDDNAPQNTSSNVRYFHVDSIYLYDSALKAGEIGTLIDVTGKPLTDNVTVTREAFLTTAEQELILNTRYTDNSPLSTSGYTYYIYEPRASVKEYAPLGYYASENDGFPALSTFQGKGWYYLTHKGDWGVPSAKNAIGLLSVTMSEDFDLPPHVEPDEEKGLVGHHYGLSYTSAGGTPLKFYIDKYGYLCCFYSENTTDSGAYGASYVYQNPDDSYVKAEALQRALGSFTTLLSEQSPTSRVSAVRFSTDKVNVSHPVSVDKDDSNKLILLNWTSDPKEAASMLSIERGDGTLNSPDEYGQYNYGLTGSTATRMGLHAFTEYLAPKSDPDRKKYVIIFTDGRDTDIGKTGTVTGENGEKYTVAEAAAKHAETLRGMGYTIYAVILNGGSIAYHEDDDPEYDGSEYGKAVDFLTTLTGNRNNVFSTAELMEKENYTEPVDALQGIFLKHIFSDMFRNLEGYSVQDYIDPRFDLVDSSGNQWHLNSDGKVVIGNIEYDLLKNTKKHTDGTEISTDEKTKTIRKDTEGKYKDKYYLSITLTDSRKIDEAAQKARLYYDKGNDMYYLVWVGQEIPASAVGEAEPEVWRSTVTVRAKDDFIGGNAVLTNGNAAGQNYVYHPDDQNANSGKTMAGIEAVKDEETGKYTQTPSKGFPRTTVNTKALPASNDNGNRIYMGEKVSWDDFEDLFQEWIGTTTTNLYWEYLERYAQISGYELSTLLKMIMAASIDGKEFTIPYYYLPNPDDNGKAVNSTGGELHKGDLIGYITYKWESPLEYDPEDEFFKITKKTDSKQTEISAEYTPLTEEQRWGEESYNMYEHEYDEGTKKLTTTITKGKDQFNENLVDKTGEEHYKWSYEQKPTSGKEFVVDPDDPKTRAGSTYEVGVVAGEIVLQMRPKKGKEQEVNNIIKDPTKGPSGGVITYSADLYRTYKEELKEEEEEEEENGGTLMRRQARSVALLSEGEVEVDDGNDGYVTEHIGVFTATYSVQPNGEFNVETASLDFIRKGGVDKGKGEYDYMFDFGLPLGTYNLVPNSHTSTGTAYLGFNKVISPVKIDSSNMGLFGSNELGTNTSPPGYSDDITYESMADQYPAFTGNGMAQLGYAGEEKDGLDRDFNGKNYLDALYALFEVYLEPVDPGEVEIEKQITGDGLGVDMDNDEFEFVITLDPKGIDTLFDIRQVKYEFTPGVGQPDGKGSGISWSAAELFTGVVTGTFKLKHNQKVRISGIPAGVEYTITEIKKSDIYKLKEIKRDDVKVDGDTGSGTIEANKCHSWKFNNEPEYGSIEVNKKVESDEYNNEKFGFTITMNLPSGVTSIEPNKIKVNGADINWSVSNKTITGTFELAKDGSVTIAGIPVGTNYKIMETNKNGFALKSVAGSGTVSGDGGTGDIDVKDEKDTWTFTNAKEYGSIEVKKVVVDKDGKVLENDATPFDFTITLTLPAGYGIGDVTDKGWTKNSDGTYSTTFSLKHGEKFTIPQVPVGTTYVIEETTADGYSLKSVDDDESATSTSGTIRKKVTDRRVFTNVKDNDCGSIEVRKAVVDKDGEELDSDDTPFNFTITLTLPEDSEIEPDTDFTVTGYDYRENEDIDIEVSWEQDTETGNWIGTFELEHGQSLKIENVPVGTTYTIVETEADGYTLESIDDDKSKSSAGGTISKGVTDERTFTNAKDDSETGSIEVKKVVVDKDGEELDSDDTPFSFTITLNPGEIEDFDINKVTVTGAELKEGWTKDAETGTYTGVFELKHNETVTIKKIPVGVKYTVQESDKDGYTLESVVTGSVDLKGNAATEASGGTFEQGIGTGGIEKNVTHRWTFTNKKSPKGIGAIEVRKLVVNDITTNSFEFTITLTLPEGSEVEPDTDFTVTGYDYRKNEDIDIEVLWEQDTETGNWIGTFELEHGQSVKLGNIPAGTDYVVRETNAGSYYLRAVTSEDSVGTVEGGTTEPYYATGTIEADESHVWTFQNTPSLDLPDTGGQGVWKFCIYGILLVAAAMFMLLDKRKIKQH